MLGPKDEPLSFMNMIMFNPRQPTPSDARALARMHLKAIDDRVVLALNKDKVDLDSYGRAHLEQVHDQIGKVLSRAVEDVRAVNAGLARAVARGRAAR